MRLRYCLSILCVVVGCASHGDGHGMGLEDHTNAEWQALECPYRSGVTVKQRLDAVVTWAETDPMKDDPSIKPLLADIIDRAQKCRDTHKEFTTPPPNHPHVWKVYAGWIYAQLAFQATDADAKRQNYVFCLSELDHMDGGNLR